MRYQPLAHSAVVVLVGNFNPAILSPARLALHSIVDQSDLEDAEVAVIHPDISEFVVSSLAIRVEPERFQISTKNEPFVRVADAVSQLFTSVLPHTPLRQVGINYQLHFALDSITQRYRLGRSLAPAGPWGDWGKELESGELEKRGGLRTLAMEESFPADREKGYRRVVIEPSVRKDIVDPRVGVFMSANDHYEVEGAAADNARAIVDLLTSNFDKSIASSKAVVEQMMEFASTL